MTLFILNLDDGDLHRIHDPSFSARKRIAHSEAQGKTFLYNASHFFRVVLMAINILLPAIH